MNKNILFITLKLIFSIHLLQAQTYTEVAKSVGIHHSYTKVNFGGGVSFYDFNGDGWDDITIATANGDSIHFYENIQGDFHKIGVGIGDTSEIKQMLWADVDNDGDQDLFTAVFEGVNYVYLNDGDMNFTPSTLPIPNNVTASKTFAATFGDFDLDGDLDLFVTHRGVADSIPNQLLENNGAGSFIDVTSNYFFDTIYQPTFCATFFDYDKDGFPDIYTAEDRYFGQNQLYRNIGNGQFENQTDSSGAGVWIDAMGLSIGDYNHDGYLDMYISNSPAGNPLFHNNGDGTFTDTANFAGVSFNEIAWGNQFLDYDNDMNLDLHVCATLGADAPDKNGLLKNNGNGTFLNATTDILGSDSTTSFASAVGDFNNDGFVDIAINNAFPDSFNLWENSGGNNHWLKINLQGTISNRDGIGSWIEVYAGGEMRTYYTMCGTSFLGQSSNTQNIGLGSNTQADSVIVKWLSGIQNKLIDVASNQLITIIEGELVGEKTLAESKSTLIFPNPFNNMITIEIEEKSYSPLEVVITNSIMQTIHTSIWNNTIKSTLSINTQAWEPGVYFIHLDNGKTKEHYTITKGK